MVEHAKEVRCPPRLRACAAAGPRQPRTRVRRASAARPTPHPAPTNTAPKVCAGGGDVLNVGFGLGLVDEEIQKHKPRSHTIVEAHPGARVCGVCGVCGGGARG